MWKYNTDTVVWIDNQVFSIRLFRFFVFYVFIDQAYLGLFQAFESVLGKLTAGMPSGALMF